MPELSPEDKREMGWQGREAQLRKKGEQDRVRTGLPSSVIFLQDQPGKWRFVPKLLVNTLLVCSFLPSALSGCSQRHHGPCSSQVLGGLAPSMNGRSVLRAS